MSARTPPTSETINDATIIQLVHIPKKEPLQWFLNEVHWFTEKNIIIIYKIQKFSIKWTIGLKGLKINTH